MAQKEITYEEIDELVKKHNEKQRLHNAVKELTSIIEEDKNILKDPQFIEMMKGFGITKSN
jgi:hypothetical protein